jgi:hypothetical protein
LKNGGSEWMIVHVVLQMLQTAGVDLQRIAIVIMIVFAAAILSVFLQATEIV